VARAGAASDRDVAHARQSTSSRSGRRALPTRLANGWPASKAVGPKDQFARRRFADVSNDVVHSRKDQ
jgi:hypothetical protein